MLNNTHLTEIKKLQLEIKQLAASLKEQIIKA
jgi:hypothetical protein